MSTNKPFSFPESIQGIMCASFKGDNTVIPNGFPITKCRPSNRGKNARVVTRPRKAGRILSWEIAEALAPDANLTYDEQEANNESGLVRHLSPEEAAKREVLDEIRKLKKENEVLSKN